ncbi:YkgJ family cysteine cluster protein [Rhodobacteraceae bacterium CH30]|nr:YkgJ family cysteine cluster protein [Rhodobacteraceae bacterium CH30]
MADPSAPDTIDAAISCSSCKACCCQLEVILMAGDDAVPARYIVEDDWGAETLRRRDDGWCAALDRRTMLCTIYAQRPWVCREYQEGDYDCLIQRKLIPILMVDGN